MRPVSDEFPVSQEFGSDATAGVIGDPNGSEVQQLVAAYGNYQPYGHAGQDIACPIGTPVHAIADGTVIWADWGSNLPGDDTDAGYRQRWYMYKYFPGIVTLIQHDGWISMYGHLSSNDAAPVGTVVKEGDLIALSGNTKAPGVTLGAHLHVGALVDLNYSCSNGYIYGCVDPTPYYGTISPQSVTITPQEDDLTPDESAQLAYIASPLFKKHMYQAVWFGNDGGDLIQDRRTGQGAWPETFIGSFEARMRDEILPPALANVPPQVLNQTLGDGTNTNVAGALSAILNKPATVTNVTSTAAPAPALDVDALVARLKAELPAAVLAELTTKLTK